MTFCDRDGGTCQMCDVPFADDPRICACCGFELPRIVLFSQPWWASLPLIGRIYSRGRTDGYQWCLDQQHNTAVMGQQNAQSAGQENDRG